MLSIQLLIWFKFLICAVLIGIAGTKLTHYADVIAEKTGLSGGWVGLILLSTVTSLPELITGVSAVIFANAPDIAVGGIMGSCVFNLVILVVLDYLLRGQSLYQHASLNHILSAAFGIVLIAFAGLSMVVSDITSLINFTYIGAYTPIIILFYLVAMRSIFVQEHAQLPSSDIETDEQYPDITLARASIGYVVCALLVVLVGIYLPFVGKELAESMGWNQTFVGTLFIAMTTSLPELAVTIAALRINALDMAIANLLGSNIFNIAILAINDLVFLPGALFQYISTTHAISAFSATVMTGIVIIGLTFRPQSKILMNIGWISVALLAFYLLNSYILFTHGN